MWGRGPNRSWASTKRGCMLTQTAEDVPSLEDAVVMERSGTMACKAVKSRVAEGRVAGVDVQLRESRCRSVNYLAISCFFGRLFWKWWMCQPGQAKQCFAPDTLVKTQLQANKCLCPQP